MQLQPEVISAIQASLAKQANREDVTAAVLEAIGRTKLAALGGTRDFKRVKQDAGLFIAQTLVDLFGASRVETLRRENGKDVATRKNTRTTLPWVDSFAPHRVLTHPKQIARILLDTSVIRKLIHGDADALVPTEIAKIRGEHAFSIADGALAELAVALLRGSVPLDDWAARVGRLDVLLDPKLPVTPGGRELAAFWGAHSQVGLDLEESCAYYRAAWAFLKSVKSPTDLSTAQKFFTPSGTAYSIQLDAANAEAVVAEAGRKWSEWVDSVASLIGDLRKDGDDVTEGELRRLIRGNLGLDMGVADIEKLDLVTCVVARRAMVAVTGNTPYRPGGKPNDPLDIDLLFGIPLPGWVCTSDDRLIRLVRSTKSMDTWKVMTPAELAEKLRSQAEVRETEDTQG